MHMDAAAGSPTIAVEHVLHACVVASSIHQQRPRQPGGERACHLCLNLAGLCGCKC